MIQERINYYKDNIAVREQNKYLGFPMYKFYPLLGNYIPTIPREAQIILFGPTGGGKTRLWKRMFFLNYINLIKSEPNCGLKPIFLFNLLEESKDEFIDGLFSMLLQSRYGFQVSPMELTSMNKQHLSRNVLSLIEQLKPVVEEIMSYCIINDNIYNPFGLYQEARKLSNTLGTHYWRKLDSDPKNPILAKSTELTDFNGWCYNNFKYHNEENQVFIITDHISRLKPEHNTDLRTAMGDWSFEYCRKQLSKNFKFNPINIMQQTVYSEEKKFDNRGGMIWDAMKPGLGDLGDNKSLAQDHHLVLAMFNPYRYNTNGTVDGFDIARLNGCYRSIIIRKSRIGPDQREIPLYFNGLSGYFKELPITMNEQTYKQIADGKY